MANTSLHSRSKMFHGICSVALLVLVSFGTAHSLPNQKDESLVRLRSPGGKKLNILMVTFHATGHVMPLISLGEELRSRGHDVTIAAQRIEGDRNPEKVVTESGLRFFEAGTMHMTKLEFETLLEELAQNPLNLLAGFRAFARMEVDVYQVLDPLFSAGVKGFGDVDIIIADGMTESGVWLAHKYGLPVVINDPHSFAGEGWSFQSEQDLDR
jgi:hypothetical protein